VNGVKVHAETAEIVVLNLTKSHSMQPPSGHEKAKDQGAADFAIRNTPQIPAGESHTRRCSRLWDIIQQATA